MKKVQSEAAGAALMCRAFKKVRHGHLYNVLQKTSSRNNKQEQFQATRPQDSKLTNFITFFFVFCFLNIRDLYKTHNKIPMLSNYFSQETHWSARKEVPLEFGTIDFTFFFKRKKITFCWTQTHLNSSQFKKNDINALQANTKLILE